MEQWTPFLTPTPGLVYPSSTMKVAMYCHMTVTTVYTTVYTPLSFLAIPELCWTFVHYHILLIFTCPRFHMLSVITCYSISHVYDFTCYLLSHVTQFHMSITTFYVRCTCSIKTANKPLDGSLVFTVNLSHSRLSLLDNLSENIYLFIRD